MCGIYVYTIGIIYNKDITKVKYYSLYYNKPSR